MQYSNGFNELLKNELKELEKNIICLCVRSRYLEYKINTMDKIDKKIVKTKDKIDKEIIRNYRKINKIKKKL